MFNFGLLSTSLPYLLLGITSLAYLATISVNQLRESSNEEITAKSIDYKEQEKDDAKTYVYQVSQSSGQTSSEKSLPSLFVQRMFTLPVYNSDPPGFINSDWLQCHILLPPPQSA